MFHFSNFRLMTGTLNKEHVLCSIYTLFNLIDYRLRTRSCVPVQQGLFQVQQLLLRLHWDLLNLPRPMRAKCWPGI